jgi:MFS transporter, SP family, general alpha glucoside:H+ symporter
MDVEKNEATAIHHESTAEEQLARLANQEEHERGKLDAIKHNPKAFAWCLYGAFVTLLVSFENQAAGIVVSIPQFRKDFGYFFDDGYVLDANWQAAFSGGAGAA